MNSLRIPLVLLATLLASAAAGAAGGKPTLAGTFGTRVQLRECLDLDDDLRARTATLQAGVAASNKRTDDNAAEDARLVEMKKTLDRSDKAAILKFNEVVLAHKQHMEQADRDADELVKATSEYNADKAAADQKCGALTYRPEDVTAVNRERKKANAIASAASAP